VNKIKFIIKNKFNSMQEMKTIFIIKLLSKNISQKIIKKHIICKQSVK